MVTEWVAHTVSRAEEEEEEEEEEEVEEEEGSPTAGSVELSGKVPSPPYCPHA